jgi:hypothetical protein
MENKEQDFEIGCTIKSAVENSGISQKTNNPYTNYVFVVIDDKGNEIKMSTFSKDQYDAWKPGMRVTCNYRKSGIYNQLVGFEGLDDGIDRTPVKIGGDTYVSADEYGRGEFKSPNQPDWELVEIAMGKSENEEFPDY